MALTPDDVLNKRFQTTKFRDGYEQDEVDDYLDVIVDTLREDAKEKEQLQEQLKEAQQKLSAAEAKIRELQNGKSDTAAKPAPAPAPAAAAPAPAAAAKPAEKPAEDSTDEATSLLELARKLHDEHVHEGEQKRDALIAEANVTSSRIIAEAEQRKTKVLSELEARRKTLQDDINDLETFEKEYRGSLHAFISRQLGDLERTGSISQQAQVNLGSAAK
ncbi:MAG: DivIVA domain-containing protein [Pseudoclavibacter sp.]